MSTVVCGGAVDLHHAFVGSGKVYSHILQVNSAMKNKTTFFHFHNVTTCPSAQNSGTQECNVIDCDCMECGHCWLLLVACVLCSWCWWVWISTLMGPSFNNVPNNVSLASGTLIFRTLLVRQLSS